MSYRLWQPSEETGQYEMACCMILMSCLEHTHTKLYYNNKDVINLVRLKKNQSVKNKNKYTYIQYTFSGKTSNLALYKCKCNNILYIVIIYKQISILFLKIKLLLNAMELKIRQQNKNKYT